MWTLAKTKEKSRCGWLSSHSVPGTVHMTLQYYLVTASSQNSKWILLSPVYRWKKMDTDLKYKRLSRSGHRVATWELGLKSRTLGFPVGWDGKESACNAADLGWEDSLEEEMAAHSKILAWRIPWTEEPGGLRSMGVTESDTTEQLILSLLMR